MTENTPNSETVSDIRQKVKNSFDPYIDGEISEFDKEENLEDAFAELDELSEDFDDLDDEETDEPDYSASNEEASTDSEELEDEDWDKWVFNNKLSPPESQQNFIDKMKDINEDYIPRFDTERSSHLWKSDPEMAEYRAFGSLREKTNNVLASNLRKYQNESLTTNA